MNRLRHFDVAVVGAAGFSGRMVVAHLTRVAPPGTRLALAGRRLEPLRALAADIGGNGVEAEVVSLDARDESAASALARSSRVLASAVGPYLEAGEQLVGACARAGTDYLDLAGEREFIDRMFVEHDEQARLSGARLVHSCGFESALADAAALIAVGHLPPGVPLRLDALLDIGLRGPGGLARGFSPGTLRSAVLVLSRRGAARSAAARREQLSPAPQGRTLRRPRPLPARAPAAGGWAVPGPALDATTVLRSARSDVRYGPDFSYRQRLLVRRARDLPALGAAGAAAWLAARLPPLRGRLLRRIDAHAEPSPELLARRSFTFSLEAEGGGSGVRVQATGGDFGYVEPARILAESALCLAFDDVPPGAGQLTPARAMGELLVARLEQAGIHFEVDGAEHRPQPGVFAAG